MIIPNFSVLASDFLLFCLEAKWFPLLSQTRTCFGFLRKPWWMHFGNPKNVFCQNTNQWNSLYFFPWLRWPHFFAKKGKQSPYISVELPLFFSLCPWQNPGSVGQKSFCFRWGPVFTGNHDQHIITFEESTRPVPFFMELQDLHICSWDWGQLHTGNSGPYSFFSKEIKTQKSPVLFSLRGRWPMTGLVLFSDMADWWIPSLWLNHCRGIGMRWVRTLLPKIATAVKWR